MIRIQTVNYIDFVRPAKLSAVAPHVPMAKFGGAFGKLEKIVGFGVAGDQAPLLVQQGRQRPGRDQQAEKVKLEKQRPGIASALDQRDGAFAAGQGKSARHGNAEYPHRCTHAAQAVGREQHPDQRQKQQRICSLPEYAGTQRDQNNCNSERFNEISRRYPNFVRCNYPYDRNDQRGDDQRSQQCGCGPGFDERHGKFAAEEACNQCCRKRADDGAAAEPAHASEIGKIANSPIASPVKAQPGDDQSFADVGDCEQSRIGPGSIRLSIGDETGKRDADDDGWALRFGRQQQSGHEHAAGRPDRGEPASPLCEEQRQGRQCIICKAGGKRCDGKSRVE